MKRKSVPMNRAAGIAECPSISLPAPGRVSDGAEQRWTRLNKAEHPEHAIARKALEIAPAQAAGLSVAEHPNTATERSRRRPHDPHHAEQNRTSRNRVEPTDLNQPEQSWTRLNKPEHTEHTIARKTLEILHFPTPKCFSCRTPDYPRPTAFGSEPAGLDV